ncbi:MAG: hypothetical protein RL077_724 [Verrucomicrobiota bacterium]
MAEGESCGSGNVREVRPNSKPFAPFPAQRDTRGVHSSNRAFTGNHRQGAGRGRADYTRRKICR